MSTTATTRFYAALGLGLGVALTLVTPATPVLADPPSLRGPCAFDPASLPHTPDAIEGWIGNCLERAGI
jgi:hypothetical protein